MRIRSQLIISEIMLSGLDGTLILTWLLGITTLQMLLVLEWGVAQIALILWFRRTDEIDGSKSVVPPSSEGDRR